MENQNIQLDNQIMLIQHIKQEDIQGCISALNNEAKSAEKQIQWTLCGSKSTKNFACADVSEKEFDNIKKEIKIHGKFSPFEFPTSVDNYPLTSYPVKT